MMITICQQTTDRLEYIELIYIGIQPLLRVTSYAHQLYLIVIIRDPRYEHINARKLCALVVLNITCLQIYNKYI